MVSHNLLSLQLHIIIIIIIIDYRLLLYTRDRKTGRDDPCFFTIMNHGVIIIIISTFFFKPQNQKKLSIPRGRGNFLNPIPWVNDKRALWPDYQWAFRF